ncbi:MAG: hypothetical protein ACK506_16155 [Pirellula sp.]
MTAAQRLAYLLESVEVRNPEGWTIKKIIAALGPAIAGKLEVSLKVMADNRVPFTQTTLNALSQKDGLGIDDDQSQALIDQLATYSQSLPVELQWDANFVSDLKSLGVSMQPRWILEGYTVEPTLGYIQSEIDQARLVNAKALFSERMLVGIDAAAVWAQAWEDAGA